MSKSIICFAAAAVAAVLVSAVFRVSAAEMCGSSSVKIEQAPTGRSAKSTPEWKVNVTSECLCAVSQLTLSCPNFEPAAAVNPAVISVDGEKNCQLSMDAPLHKNETVSFTYVWDLVDFRTLDFNIACS